MLIPRHATDIDRTWVQIHLRSHLSSDPESVACARVGAGFGLAGVTYRLVVRSSAGSDTFAVKVCKLESARNEAWVYRNVLPKTSCPTPRFVDVIEGETQGILITRFVDGATQGDVLSGCTQAQSISLAQILGDFHAAWWSVRDEELPPSHRYQPLWVRPVGEDVIERCILRHEAWISGGEEALRSHLAQIDDSTAELATQPMTIAHRDYHLDNVLFSDVGPVVIDWEGGRRAPAAYDVARMMIECNLLAQREARDDMLRRVYLDRLAAHGVSMDPAVLDRGIRASERVLLAGSVRWAGAETAEPSGSRQENLQRNLLRNLVSATFDASD